MGDELLVDKQHDEATTHEVRRPRPSVTTTSGRWRFDSAVDAARHLGSARG